MRLVVNLHAFVIFIFFVAIPTSAFSINYPQTYEDLRLYEDMYAHANDVSPENATSTVVTGSWAKSKIEQSYGTGVWSGSTG